MKLVTVKMPEMYVEAIDGLVKAGRYSSRSEAIRIAVRELLRREVWWPGGVRATTTRCMTVRGGRV